MTNNKFINEKELLNSNEIDLFEFLNILFRNKKIIGTLGFLFFIISCIVALNLKRVWQGRFEIVISKDNNKEKKIDIETTALSKLFETTNNSLETEVGILESPSVLMPIFNYVIEEKSKLNKSNVNFSFFDWRKENLEIKLRPTSSILVIKYNDKNKELIIPVLNRISESYKNYTGLKKKKSLNIEINYLKDQIKKFNLKNIESLREVQEFALENDLLLVENNLNNDITMDISTKRYSTANQLRFLKKRLLELNNIQNKFKENYKINGIYENKEIDSIISGFGLTSQNQELININNKLSRRRAVHKENDISIRKLKETKKEIIKNILNNDISLVQASIFDQEAEKFSSERDTGVLIKFKGLSFKYQRDKNTLLNLQNQLRVSELDRAKLEDPWTLITNPTLLKNPVAPSRKLIAMVGAFLGLLIGAAISIIKEYKSNIIFDKNKLTQLLDTPIVHKLELNNFDNKKRFLIFLKDLRISFKKKNIVIFNLLGLDDDYFADIRKIIKDENLEFISLESEIRELSETEESFILVEIGFNKYKEIIDLNKRLKLYNIQFQGIILVKS